MPASVAEVLFLVGAGALASLIGSAGGITSLISYPALLAVGLAPLQANIANAVALVGSGVGSTLGARPELRGHWRTLLRLAVPSVAGGTVGAALLLLTSADLFAWIVPFLIALASSLLLVQPKISTWRQRRHRSENPALALAGMFVVSIYGGYFGAGAGVLTLALLLVLVDQDLPRANAFKNVVLASADVITAVVFVLAGQVVWGVVIPVAVGAMVGGALGPAVVRRVPTRILRIAAALAGFGLSIWLLVSFKIL